MTERIRFFGLSDDKLYYDERKKRFVHLADATAVAEKAYKNSHFKDVHYKSLRYLNSNALISTDRRSMNSS